MSSQRVAIELDNSGSYYYGTNAANSCGSADGSPYPLPSSGWLSLPIPDGQTKTNLFLFNGSDSSDLVWKGYLDQDNSYLMKDGVIYPSGSSTEVPRCRGASGGGSGGSDSKNGGGGGSVVRRGWLYGLIFILLLAAAAAGYYWYYYLRK